MFVRIHYLTQSRGKDFCVRILILYPANHSLETFYLGNDVLPSGLWPIYAKAELEIFLIADKDVGDRADLGEDVMQLLLPACPEGRAVVQVEADARAVALGSVPYFLAVLAISRQNWLVFGLNAAMSPER